MIGPAEIEDMLADYEEAMNNSGVGLPPGEVSWPVTLPWAPPAPLSSDEAAERIRIATTGTFAVAPPRSH
jgi:hypothetical protein